MEKEAKIFAKALFLAAQNKKEEEKKEIAKRFLVFLKKKNKIYLLPQIIKIYQEYLKKKEGEIFFAHHLDEKILMKIKEKLENFLEKGTILKVKIKKELLGGFLLKTENYLIDASIKGLLEKIKSSLWK